MKKGASSLWHHKIEVDVLDAAAIGVSLIRQDMNTAGSTMFLLSIGETLEEWTRKRSVGNLARSMSLNVEKVWLRAEDGDVLVPATEVKVGDRVLVQMGNVIPFDGVISSGDAMVNQSSMTGEPLPIHKKKDGYVYAGTVVEEGELVLQVKTVGGASRFEKIVAMIEESEKMKSALENPLMSYYESRLAWKSIFLIPWQKQLLMPRGRESLFMMRRCIRRWSISWHMELLPCSGIRKQSLVVIILYLKMSIVKFQKGCRKNLINCQHNTHTYT